VFGLQNTCSGFYCTCSLNPGGLKKGKAELMDMLPKLTQRGSGDDVSIAGILRGVD
jgi:hypothetical protein